MKTLRTVIGLCLMLFVGKAAAQDVVEDWWGNGRPECQTAVDEVADGLKAVRWIGSQTTAPLKARGTQRVPVVLVAFADLGFTVAADGQAVNEYYRLFCNGTMDGKLYTGHGSHGSIRDYFVEQSDSIFLPEFTVIGPVTLDNGYAYYGENNYNANGVLTSRDKRFSQFRTDALTKAVELYENWDDFDNNGDGRIDMVFFVFAGMGENIRGNDPNFLWPKETTSSTTINGRVFATSAVTNEVRPTSWNDDHTEVLTTRGDGVGVFIHELSHALGLPDFYDTKDVAFGMDLWSVMDYGEYGNNGYNPGNYTAYEREFMGWETLPELTEPCILTIPCFADGGTGYRIRNEANPESEYYIIENRQPRGWDDRIGRMGHGLQVTHVDYLASRWNGNTVNTDPDHQRMTIIAANNSYKGTNSAANQSEWVATLAGNLFPGDAYNYELTDESAPAAEVFTGVLMHKPLRNITENADGTVTLCFRTFGQLETPEVGEAENVELDGFDIAWSEADHATRYAYELYCDSIVICTDTIAETNLHFGDLQPSSKLKFRVMAMADTPEDYLDSEWTPFVYVSTLSDFISQVPESEKLVDVYTLGGMYVSRCHADELGRLSLRRGIYLVRYANGAARKVLVR